MKCVFVSTLIGFSVLLCMVALIVGIALFAEYLVGKLILATIALGALSWTIGAVIREAFPKK